MSSSPIRPYVRATRRVGSEGIRRDFATARGAFDLQVPFIELALRRVRAGGRVGLLVSNKFLVTDYGRRLRAFLDHHATIDRIVDLADCSDAGCGPLINQVILTAHRQTADDQHRVALSRPTLSTKPAPNHMRSQAALLGARWPVLHATRSEQRLIEAMQTDTDRLADIALVRGGARGFDYTACCERIVEHVSSPESMAALTPGNIRAYRAPSGDCVRLAGERWIAPTLSERPESISEELWGLFRCPKLVVKGIGVRPTAALCTQPAALLVAIWGVWTDRERLLALNALINSLPAAWLHYQQLNAARIPKGSLRIPLSWLKALPVPRGKLERLAELARQRSAASTPAAQSALQDDIDHAAATAYGLGDDDLQLMRQAPVRSVQL